MALTLRSAFTFETWTTARICTCSTAGPASPVSISALWTNGSWECEILSSKFLSPIQIKWVSISGEGWHSLHLPDNSSAAGLVSGNCSSSLFSLLCWPHSLALNSHLPPTLLLLKELPKNPKRGQIIQWQDNRKAQCQADGAVEPLTSNTGHPTPVLASKAMDIYSLSWSSYDTIQKLFTAV